MLNNLCKHDISDEDCYKCIKHGIVFGCPTDCPDFDDVRKDMSPELLKQREEMMKILGVKDDPRWNK